MIYYFSATGNTLWAARQVAAATGERLVNMAEVATDGTSFTLSPNERVGILFPIHGWRPPSLVRDFVRRLRVKNAGGHFCYALCTAGDDIGESIRLLRDDLAVAGLHLDSAWSLVMPESYVGLPLMDVDTPEHEQEKKAAAVKRLDDLLPEIVHRTCGIFRLDLSHWPRINTRVLGYAFLHWLVSDRPFHVVKERCVKCGVCARVCPVRDIAGGKRQFPSWLHTGRCLTCFACYHHCPHHAIEFGCRTRHKGQYFFKS